MNLLETLKSDKDLHKNILKVATMLLVSKALSLRDSKFIIETLSILIGFTAYHLLVKKIELPFNNSDLQKISNTWLKVGTMLFVSQIYKGGQLTMDFIIDSITSILGFNITDIIIPRILPDLKNDLIEKILTDCLVVFIMNIVKNILLGRKITNSVLLSSLWSLSGFILYDLIEEIACD